MSEYEKVTLWTIEDDRAVSVEMEIVGEWNGFPVYFKMLWNPSTMRSHYRHVVFSPAIPGGEGYFQTEEEAWAWLCATKDLKAWTIRWISDTVKARAIAAEEKPDA